MMENDFSQKRPHRSLEKIDDWFKTNTNTNTKNNQDNINIIINQIQDNQMGSPEIRRLVAITTSTIQRLELSTKSILYAIIFRRSLQQY